MSTQTEIPPGEPVIVMSRLYDAPRPLLWQNADHGARKDGPPTTHITLTLEEAGKRTRWTMVARFLSLADRDAALDHGFTGPIAASSDVLVDYLKTAERAP